MHVQQFYVMCTTIVRRLLTWSFTVRNRCRWRLTVRWYLDLVHGALSLWIVLVWVGDSVWRLNRVICNSLRLLPPGRRVWKKCFWRWSFRSACNFYCFCLGLSMRYRCWLRRRSAIVIARHVPKSAETNNLICSRLLLSLFVKCAFRRIASKHVFV